MWLNSLHVKRTVTLEGEITLVFSKDSYYNTPKSEFYDPASFGKFMGQLVAIHTGMADLAEESNALQYADLQYGIGMQQAQTAGGIVTVVENEVYTECQDHGLDYEPGDFGEHLTVEWVALDTLQMGDVIFFEDEAQVEVMGPYHTPDWVENLSDVLKVINEPIGIQGKVISGGTITVDMMVHVELQTSEENY